jgi:GNAT superfamily N-acetyltransferase
LSEAEPAKSQGITVREARGSDVAQLVQLYAEAEEELAVLRGGAVLVGLGGRHPGVARSFSLQLSEPGQRVLMAFLPAPGEPAPAGYGTCVIRELDGGGLLGSIEELYVRPEARRRGAGRTLAVALAEWCKTKGCAGIDAKALPGSRSVKSFFEGQGFTARLLVMHHRLDRG